LKLAHDPLNLSSRAPPLLRHNLFIAHAAYFNTQTLLCLECGWPDAYVPPKRRYLELEQKRRIVEETLAEGASVAQIARVHGVNANLVFNWRKLYRAGQLVGRSGSKLLPVRVAGEDTPQPATAGASAARASFPGIIHIQMQDVRVRVEGSADPGLVRVVLECLAR
jgi:transposase